MAGVETKPATPLLLQVSTRDIQATATLLSGRWVDSHGAEANIDKDFIWCTELLESRQTTRDVSVDSMRRALPPHANIDYYHPRHIENPTAIVRVNDETGDEESLPGTWCLLMRAQTAEALFHTIAVFFTMYMGLQQPIRDNGFVHEKSTPGAPVKKYIVRKNKKTQTVAANGIRASP